MPPVHSALGEHVTPQEPQSSVVLMRLTQAPAHCALAPEQWGAQPPMSQTKPGGQTIPQPPQFAGSDWVSTQTPAHVSSLPGHTHAPSLHARPTAHRWLHAPQFRGSNVVSMQPPPHCEVQPVHPADVHAPS
jgi:hypothetical protein